MTCNNCGMQIADGEKFCRNCGTPLKSVPQPQTNFKYGEGSYTPPKPIKPINKKILIPVIAVVAVVLAGIIALNAYLSSTKVEREMGRALDSGVYDSVVQTFLELDEDGKWYEAKEMIRDFIADATDTLNNTYTFTDINTTDSEMLYYELVTYCTNQWGDLFFNYYNGEPEKGGLYYFGVLDDVEELDYFYKMFESKLAYISGLFDMNIATTENYDDYCDAAAEFLSVLEGDTNYSDAQAKATDALNKYVDSFITLADGYIAKGDYSSALEFLEKTLSYIDEKITGDRYTYSKTISAKIEETRKNYAAQYAAKADETFKNGDIEAAVGNIKNAIAIFPDGEYEAKLSEYQLYLPLALYDKDNCLNVHLVSSWQWLNFDRRSTSNDNREMNNAILWQFNSGGSEYYPIKANYILAGKYDSVSGEIFLPKNYKDERNIYVGYFEAYGDGKLIFTSPKMAPGILPKDINFNVSGVQELQIVFYGFGGFGINNFIAQKNIPQ